MDPKAASVAAEIAADLLRRIRRSGSAVPVGVSNRHIHLAREHWAALFGGEQGPKKYRSVKQPGFWAAEETVAVEGPKGRIEGIRLVAPYRARTQVEVSRTDALALGLKPPVRGSGKLEGALAIRIVGPRGSLEVQDALIVAQRHIHFSPAEAKAFGVADGEMLRVRAGSGGPRELVFEQVLARVSDQFALELHIDTDEANAAWVKSGDATYIV